MQNSTPDAQRVREASAGNLEASVVVDVAGCRLHLAGSFPFRLPRRNYIDREDIPGVIWIQGNCVLRKAEAPSHFKPDSKHGLLPPAAG